MPTSLGAPEILVILVVALIVLGPSKLPEAGRQIGKAMSEVRRWTQSVQTEIRDVIDVEPDPSPPTYPAPPAYPAPPSYPTPSPNGSATTDPVDRVDETDAGPPGDEVPPGGQSSS